MHTFLIVDHLTASINLSLLEKSLPSPKNREVNIPYVLNHGSVFTLSERQEALHQLLCKFYFYSESNITVIWDGDFLEEEEGRKINPHHPTIQTA